ncbi:MAG: ABC transporter substrate-binding protein [Acidimicrobiales bacterium]
MAVGTTAVALSFALAACGSSGGSASGTSSSGSSGTGSPISVGFVLPLTGNFAANAKLEEDGFKLGLKQFGSTVDGHKITVHYSDSQGTPSTGLSVAKSLVTSTHVQVMEGPLVSSTIAAVSPFVIGKGIPEDDLYLSSPQQMDLYKSSGIGLTSGWDGYQVTSAGANWAYKTQNWRHVTTIGGAFSFGWQTVGGFDAAFTKLGGKIDHSIWIPSNATDLSSYISQIPKTTQGVFVELSGAQAVTFVDDYASFGLKGTIPLLGITQLTTQSALPSEKATAALGTYTDAQYCDGLTTSTNKKFAAAFHSTFGTWPGYYADAGYVKAEILVNALKKVTGKTTTGKKLSTAMRNVSITASRGPVTINKTTWSPTQNAYICKVQKVTGTLRNVPVKTYKAVKPWGLGITKSTWLTDFTKESAGPPSP